MIITCEACNSSFSLDDDRLKPSGTKVRCSKCQEVFTVYPPSMVEEQPHVEDKTTEISDEIDKSETDLDLKIDTEDDQDVPEELDLSDLELNLNLEDSDKNEVIDEFQELELELEESDELEMLAQRAKTAAFDSFQDQQNGKPELDDLELKVKDLDELGILGAETKATVGEADESLEPYELDLGDFNKEVDKIREKEKDEITVDAESDIILGEEDEAELAESDAILEMEDEEEFTFMGLDESDTDDRSTDTSGTDLFEVEEVSEEPFMMDDRQTQPLTIETEDERSFATGKDFKRDVADEDLEPVKKGINLWLIGVLIVVLVLGGAFTILSYLGVRIPYITETTQPEDLDSKGNIHITLLDYTGFFIDNVHSGKLYVIKGQALNEYGEPRGFLQVTGNLFSKGKVLVKKDTVFCGNFLSEEDLSNLEMNVIQDRLHNRIGDKGSNIRLEPGKMLPFMIVFSDLPEELEEFTLSIESSLKS